MPGLGIDQRSVRQRQPFHSACVYHTRSTLAINTLVNTEVSPYESPDRL